MSPREIRIEDYRYDLPQNRIAITPLKNREESKLLIFREGKISHTRFFHLPDLLPTDSMIIWNDTRVIPARLEFKKHTGASIEIFLLEPVRPPLYISMFSQTGSCEWDCIIGNQKKWKGEILERVTETPDGRVRLTAEYAGPAGQSHILLRWIPEYLTLSRILELFGKTPIPPYLKRDSTEQDKTRYQTVYADFDGSVAAPTAGLHFTPDLIARMKVMNIHFNSVTLHVGSGTFIPVKSETIGDHRMHAETVIIKKSTIMDLATIQRDKLTVVGTTTLRSLESLYWLGQKIHQEPDSDPEDLHIEQWTPYDQESLLGVQDSLETILRFIDSRGLEEIRFITRLLIAPGYRFKLVNRLITNFHQPSSTLLLLVSALTGEKWREIYQYAMDHDFRFLSYGDSSLLEMQPENND